MADWEDLATPVSNPVTGWEDLAPQLGGSVPDPGHARDLTDAIIGGLKSSATGMAIRGKMPDQQLDENAPWYHRIGAAAGQVGGDLLLSGAGAVVGARAGPAGMMAGAFAAPMALREALMDAYTHNYATSWGGAWEIAKSALTGAAKGAVVGAATFGAGRVVAPIADSLGLFGGAAKLGTEISALTTASAAVEGHMPTWQNLMDNAILLGGVKWAVKIAGGMRDTYAQTGRTPDQLFADAKKDPLIAEALARGETPAAYAGLALDERIKAAVDADPRPEAIRQTLGAVDPPKLGDAPINDPVKYEYITDQDTLKGVLRNVEVLYQNEIGQQTRGVVTNTETAAAALRLVAGGDVAEHVVGLAENASELYARAHVLKGMTQNAFNQLEAIRGIPEADLTPRMKMQALAAIEQVSMTLADFRGARAEAGRALQIFQKLKRDSSVLGDAAQIAKLYESRGKLSDIANMVSRLKDPKGMGEFAEGYTKATTMEKVLEVWKAAMLTGFLTHEANIMGNVGKWIVDIPESALSATLTAVGRAAKGDPLNWAQYKARAFAPLYGLQYGALDGIKIAGEMWRGTGEHLEKGDVYRTAIEGKKGEIIRLPFKFLQMEDALFRTPAERAEAHIMAVDRAVKEELHPDTAEFRKAVLDYTDHPEMGLSDAAGAAAIERVQNAGAVGVFSERLGQKMETVQRALAGSPMQFVIPFFRTPANLLSWAAQHTPGLNLLSGRWRADFAAGGEQQSKAIARVVVGGAIALTAYSLAKDGLITGGGLFDKEQGGTKRAAGWQPYSFLVNDKYYSYQRMEPVAKVIGIAADMIEMMHAGKEDDTLQKQAIMLGLIFGNATVSTTYMSGLSNVINGVTDPNRYAPALLEQYASSLVPKILGQTAQAIDPHKREVDGILQSIQAQLPMMREKLLPKRDVWGEPMANEKWFDVMPVATSEASHDKVRTEAMRLQLAISDAPKYIEEKGPLKGADKRIELTDVQRDIMRVIAGKTAMTILAPIVNAPDWKSIPDFAKAEIYKKVIEGSRKQGAYAALPPDDAARVIMREKIVNEVIRQTQGGEVGQKPQQRTVK